MYRVIKLAVENVKRLIAAEVAPKGNVVVVGGKNGHGKTSLLDSIVYALGGKGAIPAEPVRDGANKATIKLDLGGEGEATLHVVRTMTAAGGGALTITNDAGDKKAKPQELLDLLAASKLAFDPLKFMGLAPRDQAAAVRALSGVDTTSLDERRTTAVARRTNFNDKAKALRAALPEVEPPAVEAVSVEKLMEDLEKANQAARVRMSAAAEVSRCVAELTRATKAVEDANVYRDLCQARGADAVNALEALPPAADVSMAREALRNAEATNAAARARASWITDTVAVADATAAAETAKAHVETLDQERAALVAKATLPIDGLTWTEAGVRYKDKPLDQASQAEQIRVAMAIGLALAPKLRIVLIRDGSLLDDDSMALIEEFVASHDAQAWIERVGDHDPGAVVIEDGTVRG